VLLDIPPDTPMAPIMTADAPLFKRFAMFWNRVETNDRAAQLPSIVAKFLADPML